MLNPSEPVIVFIHTYILWTSLSPFAASAGHWVVDSRPALGDIWHNMAVPAALRSVLVEVTAAPEEEAHVLEVEKEPGACLKAVPP